MHRKKQEPFRATLNSKWSVNLTINKYKRNWIKKTEKAYLYYPDDALEYYNVKSKPTYDSSPYHSWDIAAGRF